MGSFSIWHWLVVLLVVLLLFGSGKISGLMGDLAKGIKSFKQNIKEDEKDASMEAQAPATPPAGNIQGPAAAQATAAQAQPAQPGSRPAA
ncbi:twin-arginine translocase TatA/TatE family subunit [Roseomonas sp. CECT 9278]|uniref:twin-arginine translocase TatA/TatE family subunit n=1 Tax=Roseomonas sp. CECT 9278 TaxID=2845823 RepID=UPI001E4C654B|nr:twin-arginine translocase TatA/TatE family subunit [Roseomonas sp. CECT 9278]CAH0214726.1 Sec-independent protein translocase protein TatA [Roseomonas sp. CECT 9278]